MERLDWCPRWKDHNGRSAGTSTGALDGGSVLYGMSCGNWKTTKAARISIERNGQHKIGKDGRRGWFLETDGWASLTNLYAFQQAVITIRQRYFDGIELLFPDSDRSLYDLTKHTEELITSLNDQVIKKSEDKINIETLRQSAGKIIIERVSYLVDMAKAEALDAMGENRSAVELIERHLGK